MPQREDKSVWETLGLSSADATEQQPITRRVVVVGDALSGKRTFASRLFAAVTQQFPSSSISLINGSTGGGGGGVGGGGSGNRTLSHHLWREATEVDAGNNGRSNSINSAAATTTASTAASVIDGTTSLSSSQSHGVRQLVQFPHGAGIAQVFAIQRISSSRSSFPVLSEDGMGNSSLYRGSIGPSSLGGGVRRMVVEFFCCDGPGALAMALPTVEALETSVVLVMVDAGTPWRLQDQLQRWYAHLNSHVVHTLRVELPRQDEVRRMRMIEQQQRFWNEQQQALGTLRRRWGDRDGWTSSGGGGGTAPLLGVPSGGVSPLRTMLICSKIDQLEKLSREAERLCCSGPCMEGGNVTVSNQVPIQVAWATPCVRSTLRTTGLSLLDLVGQLLRREAIERQSALVGIGSHVNTIATSFPSQTQPTAAAAAAAAAAATATATATAASTAAGTPAASASNRMCDEAVVGSSTSGQGTFVHPFYKNLWSYILHLLCKPPMAYGNNSSGVVVADALTARGYADDDDDEDSGGGVDGDGRNGSVPQVMRVSLHPPPLFNEIEAQVSSRFHPHAFLPHGMDHLELLSPFVTSTDAVTLDSLFATTGGTAGATTLEDGEVDEKTDVLQLHERYMQQIENMLAATKPSDDEDVMIWDDP